MNIYVIVLITCRTPSTPKPAQTKQHTKYYQCPAMQMHLKTHSSAWVRWTAEVLGAKRLWTPPLFLSDPSTFGSICSSFPIANTSYHHEHYYSGLNHHHPSSDNYHSLLTTPFTSPVHPRDFFIFLETVAMLYSLAVMNHPDFHPPIIIDIAKRRKMCGKKI